MGREHRAWRLHLGFTGYQASTSTHAGLFEFQGISTTPLICRFQVMGAGCQCYHGWNSRPILIYHEVPVLIPHMRCKGDLEVYLLECMGLPQVALPSKVCPYTNLTLTRSKILHIGSFFKLTFDTYKTLSLQKS